MIYIFWTAQDRNEATKVVRILLNKRLIACASIFPVESIYTWKGVLEESTEMKVLLKSLPKHFHQIEGTIKQNSTYEVSEIAAIPAIKVSEKYQTWLEESL